MSAPTPLQEFPREDHVDVSKSADSSVTSCVCTYMECGRRFPSLKSLEEHVTTFHNTSWGVYMEYYHRWVKPTPSGDQCDLSTKSPLRIGKPPDPPVPASGVVPRQIPPQPAPVGIIQSPKPQLSLMTVVKEKDAVFKSPTTTTTTGAADITPDIITPDGGFADYSSANRYYSKSGGLHASGKHVPVAGHRAVVQRRSGWTVDHPSHTTGGLH